MAKRQKKFDAAPTNQAAPKKDIPPGATRKALDRPLDRGGGSPASAAGPRHAADDVGTDDETYGMMEINRTLASPPIEEEDSLDRGPPYAGRSGGAVGGTPAQLRSSEGAPHHETDAEPIEADHFEPAPVPTAFKHDGDRMRLTGFAAIEYAEKQSLTLNKHPDSINGPRVNLNIGEAAAIADEDPELIWLDVSKEDYYSGPPTSFEPEY